MEFTCRLDACFNGGICVTNGSQSHCLCTNPYFGQDFTFFHDSSCTLPENYYLGQFIYFAIVSLPICGLMTQKVFKAKGKSRLVLTYNIIAVLNNVAFTLATFLQNGNFEACSFFLMLTIVCMNFVAWYLTQIEFQALKIVGEADKQLFFSRLKYLLYGDIICSIVLLVLWIYYCRTTKHNFVMVGVILSMFVWSICFAIEIFRFSHTLVKTLDSFSQNFERVDEGRQELWKSNLEQMKYLRLTIFIFETLLVFSTFPMVFLFFALGACPYCFVLVFLSLHCPVIVALGLVFIYRVHHGVKNETIDKEGSMTVQKL